MFVGEDHLSLSLAKWLEAAFALEPGPAVVAFCLNLYDSPFRADIIGATHYDPTDSDWACDEAWRPDIPPFDFPEHLSALEWGERQSVARGMLVECLDESGEVLAALRAATVVAVGFVGGDLVVVRKSTT